MTTESVADRAVAAWVTLTLSCVATLLVLINFTAPVSTVGIIGADLDSGASGRTWILGSISLGLAVFLLVSGSLADDFGRKRVFVLGGALLGLSSVACALAPTTVMFVLARIVQGGASAALLASGLGLLGHVFVPGPEQARATGLWGAMVGAGIAVGPVFSALLIKVAAWPAAYWVIAILAALLTLWAALSLEESRSDHPRGLDIAGVVTLGGGLALLVAALTESRQGWAQPKVLVFLAFGLVLLIAFVLVERTVAEPMLELELLRRPAFLAATVGAVMIGVAVIGFMTYVPAAAQRVLGLGPLAGAGILGVWSGLSFVVAPQARRLIGVLGARHQVAGGLALCGLGELALVGITEWSSWWWLVPGLALAGVGSGFANAALAGLAVRSVPNHRVAMGSGANNTARYVGSSLGIALIAAMLSLAPGGQEPGRDFAIGMTYAALVSAVLSLLGAVVVALCHQREYTEIPSRGARWDHLGPTKPSGSD
ncbi:Major Facilitator Superfamily protein [Actinopolyspora mzabensis]|uniref:Major Facilitator Superfamily protein n=1 Tax=Actinopolyspora mzabensis TaxID=995066 RepID=A0A1G8Z5R1_ACTMZ|nr:MFS transporter [Actinopolyspora mzabensis]SDK10419.1 Major Facilitator Superfamily protein [Actinopolyspora mzabensis]